MATKVDIDIRQFEQASSGLSGIVYHILSSSDSTALEKAFAMHLSVVGKALDMILVARTRNDFCDIEPMREALGNDAHMVELTVIREEAELLRAQLDKLLLDISEKSNKPEDDGKTFGVYH